MAHRIGPNGLGYVNVPAKVSLTIASRHKRRPGGISVISQSGAMLIHFHRLAINRGIGLSDLVSSGNEAMLGAADFLEHFIEDPEEHYIELTDR